MRHVIFKMSSGYHTIVWLSQNTNDDARIMSWEDYGYQILGRHGK